MVSVVSVCCSITRKKRVRSLSSRCDVRFHRQNDFLKCMVTWQLSFKFTLVHDWHHLSNYFVNAMLIQSKTSIFTLRG